MRLSTIVAAAAPLQKLIQQDIPIRKAWELTQLVSRINPMLEFYGQQLTRCETDEAVRELGELEMEGFEDCFRLELWLGLPVSLSAADVHNLEPFVRFCEEE